MSSGEPIRLGDVATFIRGITFKPADVVKVGTVGSVACLRTRNVQAELDLTDVWGVAESLVKRPDQFLEEGDTLVSSANSWNLVGKCSWVPAPPWRATFGGFVSVLRAKPNKVDPKYLFRWFSSKRTQETVRSFGQQTTNISNLNIERCLDHPIPLPPLSEQRRIAEVLDRAEALRAKRRAALAQLDSLTQSIFLEMFGDPVTNPMGWPLKRIGEIAKVVTGNTPPREIPEYYGTVIEWIKSDNVNTPDYYLTKAVEGLSESGLAVARTAPPDSILITCIAGSPECIGNSAMTDRPVAFNQQINALVPSVGDPHFLYAQIRVGKRLIQSATTGGMKGMVSKGRLEQVALIFPPAELQRELAAQLSTVAGCRSRQAASLSELEELFASVQHRAFRGEL